MIKTIIIIIIIITTEDNRRSQVLAGDARLPVKLHSLPCDPPAFTAHG